MSVKTIASGIAVVAAVTAAATLSAVPATAATTAAPAPTTSAVSPSAAPFVTVTSPGTYVPSTRPVISGTATPNADVYLSVPGFPLYNQRIRADAAGDWSYQLSRATSGNFTGNTVGAVSGGVASVRVGFTLTAAYPTSNDDSAALRPIAVTSTKQVGPAVYEVSGTATPGALVLVRARGLSQGTTVADASGAWTTRVGADGAGPWTETGAFQKHASGSSSVLFTLAG